MEEILKENKSSSHKEFEKLLSKDLGNRKLKEGEIITGTVSKIGKKFIYVDIAAKSEGAISIDEFKLAKEEVSLGAKIDVLLERMENKYGDVVISREKARKVYSWKKMEKSFETKEPVTGNIVGRVKGGFCVDVASCLCFLPGSQVSIKPLNSGEINKMMKEPQTFEVVKMDTKRGNIVLSRRSIMEKARDHDRDKIVSKLKVGDIIDGTVKALVEWGCFIDLNGVDSLLHITDISYSRISKPSDLLSIGQTIKVKITKITEDKKISVSVKDLSEDPYINQIDKFKKGKNYPATVTKVVEYGAFASLAPGLEGLIHSSEMSHTKKNVHPGKILSTSQKIEVQILDKDTEKRRISLSYKNTQPNPWTEFMKEL
jgi:small subunit ribosomal protein S1